MKLLASYNDSKPLTSSIHPHECFVWGYNQFITQFATRPSWQRQSPLAYYTKIIFNSHEAGQQADLPNTH